jgi:hypothetical protein
MNARNRHLINILSTGVLVTILTFVGLFWARWHLHLIRVSAVQEVTAQVKVRPTGLYPFENADDPNLVSPSSATADFSALIGLFTNLGAPHYALSHLLPGPDSNVYRWETKEEGVRFYFDPSRGLMVYGRVSNVQDPNGTTRRRYISQFAGPEGVAETPEASLGRFESPISDGFYENNPQTVYDKRQRRFFVIRWRDGLVQKGLAGEELPICQDDGGRRSLQGSQRGCPCVGKSHSFPLSTVAANELLAVVGSERIRANRPTESRHVDPDPARGPSHRSSHTVPERPGARRTAGRYGILRAA